MVLNGPRKPILATGKGANVLRFPKRKRACPPRPGMRVSFTGLKTDPKAFAAAFVRMFRKECEARYPEKFAAPKPEAPRAANDPA